MMYCVDTATNYAEFDSYREAEIYCGERGLSCENIYEIDEDEWDDCDNEMGFDPYEGCYTFDC